MASTEYEYPWAGPPRILAFPTEEKFASFTSSLTSATKELATKYHFDSLTSLLDLHSRFLSSNNASLKDVWEKIPVEECAGKEDLTCVGLALRLRDILIKTNPEWEDYVGMTITNEWTNRENVPDSFWTDKRPPVFPEQCREHSLLFIRVSLDLGRRAIVFLDPGRCLGSPLVVTEDGRPPQSPTMKLERHGKTKEHTLSWCGSDYIRWIMGTRKELSYSEMQLRVYVGGSFLGGSYLDWHNLMFPYRALMIMTSEAGLGCYLRIDVAKNTNHLIVCLNNQKGNNSECVVPFVFKDEDLDQAQELAINAISDRIGRPKLIQLIGDLGTVVNDKEFVEQFLGIWNTVKQETEDSLTSSCIVTDNGSSII